MHGVLNTAAGSGVFLYVQVRVHGVVQKLLVPRMMAQVPVQDRTFLFRRYRRCFVGSDAVAWLVSRRFASTVPEAEALGNALLDAGLFRHVRNEHRFRAGNYFYRFAAHEDYAVDDDQYAGLRSSRLMSVATRAYASARVTAASSSDDSTFDENEHAPAAPFDEKHVEVDVGIRHGGRMYPDLVSRFSTISGLARPHRRGSRVIPDSFTGMHAATWLVRQAYVDCLRDAVAVGNAMIKAGVFFPIDDTVAGFEADETLYRLTADVDFSTELRRGEMKDALLRALGINRSRGTDDIADANTPWFEDSLSFTTQSSM